MSDYSNYSVSDENEFSDEDNYAGAYGGYDDLYDDVMEEAGYDAWDIEDEEFGFDEERYLFEFDPFVEYFDLKDNLEELTMTYQSLLELAEMTCQLLSAWKKRKLIGGEHDVESNDDEPFNSFGLNLYQLDPTERDELRSYSINKLLRVFGGEEEVLNFVEQVSQLVKFLKKCLLHILGGCLPPALPYPVLSSILSHLLAIEGLDKFGQVTKQESQKILEIECMDKLYLSLADVYDHLKVVMFNIEPNTHSTEPSLKKKNDILSQVLAELAEISGITSSQEILEVVCDDGANPEGVVEMIGEKVGNQKQDVEQTIESIESGVESLVVASANVPIPGGSMKIEEIVEEVGNQDQERGQGKTI